MAYMRALGVVLTLVISKDILSRLDFRDLISLIINLKTRYAFNLTDLLPLLHFRFYFFAYKPISKCVLQSSPY